MTTTLKVSLHPQLAPYAPEVRYVFRTLLRLAGYGYEFLSNGDASGGNADIYYGPENWPGKARWRIAWCGKSFTEAGRVEPASLHTQEGHSFLEFGESQRGFRRAADGSLTFASDIIFGAYWLLTGAAEPRYQRDRVDNLSLDGSFFLRNAMLQKPLVSLYAQFLREYFSQLGRTPLDLPWGGKAAAFAFTHDVDYPEMIRWIECVRLLAGSTHAPRRALGGVITGSNHFWRFQDWIEMERRFGARPAFYFSARRGSLLQYAQGTPDCLYDIRSPRFRDLFRTLREEGCEIGLHASFHAFKSVEQLRQEKAALEDAAGVTVAGGRHHYWRLNPDAPHETLARHQQIGMRYDTSLAFEFYPGFRRGICHPFHPFDPETRRELDIVEFPPSWMDDHFDRRLVRNGVADPAGPEPEVAERTTAHACRLLDAVRSTGGVAVVDYHVRGMNSDFFPRYGPWLARFAEQHLDTGLHFATPEELSRQYREYEEQLDALTQDGTQQEGVPGVAPSATPVCNCPAAKDLAVGLLTPAEEKTWEDFVTSRPEATVYHSLGWKRVTEEGLGHRPYYLRALDADGKLVGVLPLFLVTGLFGRRLVSVPMRDRGGVVAEGPSVAAALLQQAVELTRRLNCKYLEIRSSEGLPKGIADGFGFQRSDDWITTRLDLTPGRDALWKALDKNAVRWAIGKAERQGLRFVADNSESAVRLFHSLFARTRSGMGIPVFPWRFFRAMWRHLIQAGDGQLFIVYQGNEPINAMLCFASKETFIPAYAAPQNHWRKLYPNEFMIWHSIVWALEHGFRSYDFGADSFRQEGLLFFKHKWGGVQQRMAYDFFLHRTQALPDFDSSAPAYRMMRRLWRTLPRALSTPLGGWVTRQLS